MSREDCLNNVLPLNWVAAKLGWSDVGLMQRLEREGRLVRKFGKMYVDFDDYLRIEREGKKRAA